MHYPVRAINRSGRRPGLMPEDVEIVAAFGLKPTPIADGLKKTLDWYRGTLG
jgi:hypothetical protein